MKKIIVALVFMGMFVLSFSQTKLFLGPSGGLNLNAIRTVGGGNGAFRSNLLLGATAGAPFEVRFTDIIAIQSGILYAQRGGTEEFFKNKLQLHQLEIPLYAKIGYGQNDKWQVYGIAGFKLGVGLKGTYSDKNNNNSVDLYYGGTNGLKRGYIGLATGVGYSVQLGPGKLVADFTYDIAMSKVYRGEFLIGGDVIRRQTNANFAVGYLFLLNGKGK